MASSIYAKLATIQQSIKVPKEQNNAFAGFKYRSAEDILEKLKPLLAKENVVVLLSDDIQESAGQTYVKATATFFDYEATGDETDRIWVSAFAREEVTRPKMSEGQLTGAASSYARKYALNGLFLLDDGKDPDSQDNSHNAPEPVKRSTQYASLDQVKTMMAKAKEASGLGDDRVLVLNWFTEKVGMAPNQVAADEVPKVLEFIEEERDV